MPEGLAPARPVLRTHPRESSDPVTTLWLAGRGVYRSADDGYGSFSTDQRCLRDVRFPPDRDQIAALRQVT